MVQLPADLVERLDRRAVRAKASRSQLVREAIAAFLEVDADDDITRAYAEGYQRVPADAPDEWGDIASLHDELSQLRNTPPLP